VYNVEQLLISSDAMKKTLELFLPCSVGQSQGWEDKGNRLQVAAGWFYLSQHIVVKNPGEAKISKFKVM
jgi:hypothetical protein